MSEKKLRLIQVAKEFKVGMNTITDFLQKKGIKSDGSPNSLVDSDVYAVLEKEYGANRSKHNERDTIRERISHKQVSVSIEPEVSEPAPKSKEFIDDKPSLEGPKILGKIDINKPAAKKSEPAPQPAKASVPPTPPVEAA